MAREKPLSMLARWTGERRRMTAVAVDHAGAYARHCAGDGACRKSPELIIEVPIRGCGQVSGFGVVSVVSSRSARATGSSQWGQSPPRPTRVQGWLQSWHHCWAW